MDVFDLDESDYDSLPMHQNHTSEFNMSSADTYLEHHANESHLNVSHYDQHPYLKLHNQYHPKRDPSHRFFFLNLLKPHFNFKDNKFPCLK
jgi:hypothetical protein